MSEQDKMAQFVFTVVIAPANKQYDVELWDFAGDEPKQLSTGQATNWRTALGEALSKICLLYTSPSPRDRQKSRMPSSA